MTGDGINQICLHSKNYKFFHVTTYNVLACRRRSEICGITRPTPKRNTKTCSNSIGIADGHV